MAENLEEKTMYVPVNPKEDYSRESFMQSYKQLEELQNKAREFYDSPLEKSLITELQNAYLKSMDITLAYVDSHLEKMLDSLSREGVSQLISKIPVYDINGKEISKEKFTNMDDDKIKGIIKDSFALMKKQYNEETDTETQEIISKDIIIPSLMNLGKVVYEQGNSLANIVYPQEEETKTYRNEGKRERQKIGMVF